MIKMKLLSTSQVMSSVLVGTAQSNRIQAPQLLRYKAAPEEKKKYTVMRAGEFLSAQGWQHKPLSPFMHGPILARSIEKSHESPEVM